MTNKAIICVDDETMILNSLEMQLRDQFGDQYVYEFAENAEDALEIIEELVQDDVKILVIVSDWLMPGTKGDEFLIQVHARFPKIVKVMLTGQAEEQAVLRAKEEANLHCCIRKPWNTHELMEAIQSGLANVQ